MEPPIQTLYLRSGGATTLTFIEDGARCVISLFMRSAMPGNIVVPAQPTQALRCSTCTAPTMRATTSALATTDSPMFARQHSTHTGWQTSVNIMCQTVTEWAPECLLSSHSCTHGFHNRPLKSSRQR